PTPPRSGEGKPGPEFDSISPASGERVGVRGLKGQDAASQAQREKNAGGLALASRPRLRVVLSDRQTPDYQMGYLAGFASFFLSSFGRIFFTSATIASMAFSSSSPFLKAWLASTLRWLYRTTVTSASLETL